MGWAARAKVSDGNPKPPDTSYTYIQADALQKARARGQTVVAEFGDRRYFVQPNGQLRRVDPALAVRPVVRLPFGVEIGPKASK